MTRVRLALPTDDRFVAPGRDLPVTWSISTDIPADQVEFEFQVSEESAFTSIVEEARVQTSDQRFVIPGRWLLPRRACHIRVRVDLGETWSEWSDPVAIEGTLDAEDWVASGITLPDDPGRTAQAPPPLLRRCFDVEGSVVSARLHVTSRGIHHITINGAPTSDELFNPGWTSYHHRLLSATFDVTSLIQEGENVIGAVLGDGWYRGRLGWDPNDTRGRYGRDLALVAQLELTMDSGERLEILTDGTWKAATGPVRRADFYDGCDIDLRMSLAGWDRPGFDDGDWLAAEVVDVDTGIVHHRSSEPVRPIDSWPVELAEGPEGALLLDGGQNISGFVRLRVDGDPGDTVVVRHAEVLNPDGSLHTRALRSAEATDRYVLGSTGESLLEPMFTFHGFRYATVESSARVLGAEFVAISSDLPQRGSFRCSDSGLNRLHENVMWSLRDNFVAVPTDCPQRDERLGWTGDAQAFAATSATLVDSLQFWKSWLTDLALDQHPELGPPAVVPDVVLDGPMRFGRAGWADAATIVPWAMYESYGDRDVLERQFESMQSWIDSLVRRAGPEVLLPEEPQFGDWLDPDAPGDQPWAAKVDSTFVANAFYAMSAAILADASRALERPDTASRYDDLAHRVGQATWLRWKDHIETTQSGCAIALQSGVVPPDERSRIATALASLVRDADGRVSTGFLGTPLVLPALASEGFFDEAYRMLLCHDLPSWLYQVDHGATTTWERWDAIRPDGSIHPGDMSPPPGTTDGGHMLSFNHYAYGAVVDWIYRHLGGIAPDRADPGYRTVQLAPRPPVAVTWAETAVETAFGRVELSWSVGEVFEAIIDLPAGVRGRFDGPVGSDSEQVVDGIPRDGVVELAPGPHRVTISSPVLAEGA